MPEIRVFNPARPLAINSRHAKPWTQKQAAARKDQAEAYVRSVLENDERADEILDMSAAEYAASRGKQIANPRGRSGITMKRKTSSSAVTSYGNSLQANALRTNADSLASLAVANSKLADQNKALQARLDKAEGKIDSLQTKLDDVADVVACNDTHCDAQDHLDDIEAILGENGNGGNGNGDDDDDD